MERWVTATQMETQIINENSLLQILWYYIGTALKKDLIMTNNSSWMQSSTIMITGI